MTGKCRVDGSSGSGDTERGVRDLREYEREVTGGKWFGRSVFGDEEIWLLGEVNDKTWNKEVRFGVALEEFHS